MEEIRLNKYLAECGICSRREADKLIEAGKVTVNGKVAGMGVKVTELDTVLVGKKVLHSRNAKVVLAYYKPVGVTCTEKDRFADRKVTEEIGYPVRVTYAGRLDKDSEGLLLLTNDGELIQQMMKASNGHEKEYIVKTKQEVTEDFLAGLRDGVYLKELEKTTRPCQAELLGKYTFRIILTQGLNRQIRRMCQAYGREVVSLKRVRIMNITIDKLQQGEYRRIEGEELRELYRLAAHRQS